MCYKVLHTADLVLIVMVIIGIFCNFEKNLDYGYNHALG